MRADVVIGVMSGRRYAANLMRNRLPCTVCPFISVIAFTARSFVGKLTNPNPRGRPSMRMILMAVGAMSRMRNSLRNVFSLHRMDRSPKKRVQHWSVILSSGAVKLYAPPAPTS